MPDEKRDRTIVEAFVASLGNLDTSSYTMVAPNVKEYKKLTIDERGWVPGASPTFQVRVTCPFSWHMLLEVESRRPGDTDERTQVQRMYAAVCWKHSIRSYNRLRIVVVQNLRRDVCNGLYLIFGTSRSSPIWAPDLIPLLVNGCETRLIAATFATEKDMEVEATKNCERALFLLHGC